MVGKREDVKRQFESAGVSIKEWSKARGYNPRTVYAVLNGSLDGKRGISHRIALDLGLKTEVNVTVTGLKVA